MQLYHNTYAADAILAGGFEDRTGSYLTETSHTGVWLADRPLEANEEAKGNVHLVMEIPDEVALPFEWVEEGKMYREFLIPADIVNRFGPPKIHDAEFVD